MSVARIDAVICVALTKAVFRPAPFTCTTDPAKNPVPFTVSVNPEPPAVTLDGAMEVIVGTPCPCAATPATTANSRAHSNQPGRAPGTHFCFRCKSGARRVRTYLPSMKPASLTRGEVLHLPAVAGRITCAFDRNQVKNGIAYFDSRYFRSKRLPAIALAKASELNVEYVSFREQLDTGGRWDGPSYGSSATSRNSKRTDVRIRFGRFLNCGALA